MRHELSCLLELPVVLAVVMFGLGLALTVAHFARVLRCPPATSSFRWLRAPDAACWHQSINAPSRSRRRRLSKAVVALRKGHWGCVAVLG